MTINEALLALSNYPIPPRVIEVAGVAGGVDVAAEFAAETIETIGYMKAERHCLSWLLTAPNSISEQGVSFSISDTEKAEIRKRISILNNYIDKAEVEEGETPEKRPQSVVFFSGGL